VVKDENIGTVVELKSAWCASSRVVWISVVGAVHAAGAVEAGERKARLPPWAKRRLRGTRRWRRPKVEHRHPVVTAPRPSERMCNRTVGEMRVDVGDSYKTREIHGEANAACGGLNAF
jgi:hypothetical protein